MYNIARIRITKCLVTQLTLHGISKKDVQDSNPLYPFMYKVYSKLKVSSIFHLEFEVGVKNNTMVYYVWTQMIYHIV